MAHMTRRQVLLAAAAASSVRAQFPSIPNAIVARNDLSVESYIERQNTDPHSRWRGSVPDLDGLHQPGAASGVLIRGVASYLHPESRFHEDPLLMRRLMLAADHLARVQSRDGNFDLLTTNFNSPPDTSFITLNTAVAGRLAREGGLDELFGAMEPMLRKSGEGLVDGGIHTPNHRWVACAALAHMNDLFPDPRYVRRAEQWLAETIDIDSDGQYSEQSTTVYNAIVDNCLTLVSMLLDKPRLLDHVRANLEAMLYLRHHGGEVVTEISHRQDRNTVGDMRRYWTALRYLSRKDQDGRYQTILNEIEPAYASLAHLMAYPAFSEKAPEPKPLPDDYEKEFPRSNLVHIRRGKTSAVVTTQGSSRVLSLRRGQAVINGVRFASAFFGKAQFIPTEGEKDGDVFVLKQELEAAYYQPFVPSRVQPWGVDKWYEMRPGGREATEINRIQYRAEIRELEDGFDMRVVCEGVEWIPLAVEINLRAGGDLRGVETTRHEDRYVLKQGRATYRMGDDVIRFGPGMAENTYVDVRGAEPKLPGPSVYLTGYTPFDHTVEFRWS